MTERNVDDTSAILDVPAHDYHLMGRLLGNLAQANFTCNASIAPGKPMHARDLKHRGACVHPAEFFYLFTFSSFLLVDPLMWSPLLAQ